MIRAKNSTFNVQRDLVGGGGGSGGGGETISISNDKPAVT